MAGQTLVQMICKSVHANFAAMHGRFPMRSAEGVTVFASQQQHLRYVCFCAWTSSMGLWNRCMTSGLMAPTLM